MANDNQPGNAPQHMSSQIVPPGNQTQSNGPTAPSLEKQMLELARREKEVRKQQEALKGMVSMESLREKAKSDKYSVLKELGLDDLIPKDANDPISALQKQIEDMKQQAESERQQKERTARLEALRNEIAGKTDDYELINALGYHEQVFDSVEGHRSEHGEMPDVHSYAKQLEDLLFQQIASAKGTKKVSGLFQQSEPKPGSQAKHPLDQSTTMTSSDRTSTQQPTDSAPSLSRQQQIESLSKHIKFND